MILTFLNWKKGYIRLNYQKVFVNGLEEANGQGYEGKEDEKRRKDWNA